MVRHQGVFFIYQRQISENIHERGDSGGGLPLLPSHGCSLDPQLIQATGAIPAADVVPLQNGCACCTLREELLASVGQLAHQGRFDHIVIELSGVAEPGRVRATLDYAREAGDLMAARLEV